MVPGDGDADAALAARPQAVADCRMRYAGNYELSVRPHSPAMRDPNPGVFLILEGAPKGIRVNPDAVPEGSRIWHGDWLKKRGDAYGQDAAGLAKH